MCKFLGLLLIIVGGFLLFEGFERKEAAATKPDLAAAGWVNSLEASPRVNAQLIRLGAGGLLIVSSGVLMEAELGHFVEELGVEEALLAGLGLEDFGLEGVNALLVDGFVVKAGRKGGLTTQSDKSRDRQNC